MGTRRHRSEVSLRHVPGHQRSEVSNADDSVTATVVHHQSPSGMTCCASQPGGVGSSEWVRSVQPALGLCYCRCRRCCRRSFVRSPAPAVTRGRAVSSVSPGGPIRGPLDHEWCSGFLTRSRPAAIVQQIATTGSPGLREAAVITIIARARWMGNAMSTNG